MKGFNKAYWDEVHLKVRLNKKWCVMRYPNPAMSQLAERSTEDFSDFYYRVCTLDYARMSKAMDPLTELMATATFPTAKCTRRPCATP